MCVRNEMISEIAPTIFIKLGMKLGDNKCEKIDGPDFREKFLIYTNLAKRPKKWSFWHKITVFGTCEKTAPPVFLKLGPKVVLYDRIIILPAKI